jgi:hypothetical protein
VIIDQQVENIDHIGKQLHFGYVKNRSSFVCINAEYMKHEKKLISFGLFDAEVSGFYKQTIGRTNSYKSILRQNIFFYDSKKRNYNLKPNDYYTGWRKSPLTLDV